MLQQSGNNVTLMTNANAPSGSSIYLWTDGMGATFQGNAIQSFTFPPQQGLYVVQLFVTDSLDTNWCAFGNFTVMIETTAAFRVRLQLKIKQMDRFLSFHRQRRDNALQLLLVV
ncbi:MAG: hypothetical protein R2850_01445 [Bacteroidia bacterium]